MNSNLAYQEESWEELMNGRFVAMSPRPLTVHNIVARNVNYLLFNHLRHGRCTPFSDGEDLYLTDKDRFVPDGMVVCDPDKIRRDGVYGTPDLVLEVLSPSTAKYDRLYKKSVYEKCGVREYWIVNPADKTVEQYLLEEEDGRKRLVLHELLAVMPEELLAKMTEEERAEIRTEFPCGIFPDLTVRLEDVFWRVE